MPTTFAGSMLKAWYIIDYKLVKWQICLEKSFFGFGNSKWVEDLISSTNIPLMFIDRCKIILIGSPHLFTNFCFLNSWQHVLGYKSRCSARSSKCFGHRFSEHLLLSQFKKWYHLTPVNFDFFPIYNKPVAPSFVTWFCSVHYEKLRFL